METAPPSASPAAPPSAADRALSHIRSALLTGDYPPGTMLSEAALAGEIGVSRTPVRAALRHLQDEGLVTIYPKRGALVREPTVDEIREAAEVRHAMETAGVQFADPDRRRRLRDDLAANLADQERALADGDCAAFARSALVFHRAFVALSGNTLMLGLYERLQDQQMLSILRSTPTIAGQPAQVLDEHHGLLAAAGDGDWQSFADRLRSHQAESHRLP